MTKIERQELWRERVAAYRAAGAGNKAAWCREHGLQKDQLRYWLERFPAEADAGEAPATMQWLAVRPEVQPPVTPCADRLLVHVGRAAVEVSPGFNRMLLADVVEALTAQC